MKVLSSVDIEGVAGVSRPDQTTPGSIDHDNARRLMTEEANAAIRGCHAAGAEIEFEARSAGEALGALQLLAAAAGSV